MSRKTLRVFEHERLRVGESRIATDGSEVTFGQAQFDELARFQDTQAAPLLQVGHRSIKFTQYVGFLQVGRLGIEILPKADAGQGREQDKPRWHAALLQMLRVAGHLDLHTPTVASLALDRADLLEIFVARFLDEVDRLLHQGLAKGYREIRGNRTSFSGRLLVADNIRHNLAHAERFFVAHQSYDHAILANQILVEALAVLDRVSLTPALRARAAGLHAMFPAMPRRTIRPDDFARLHLTRNTARYRRALELAELLLRHHSPKLQVGPTRLLALLFDMNDLWERYIGRLLRKVAPPDVSVRLQDSRPFWKPAGSPARSVRPDIIVRSAATDEPLLALDTKWKTPPNGSPSDADLKQMFVYNELFGCPHAVLVYPAAGQGRAASAGRFAAKEHACGTAFITAVSRQESREQLRELLATVARSHRSGQCRDRGVAGARRCAPRC